VSSLDTTPPHVGALGPQNPFPGLRPYQEVDAGWFFGRGREINELLKRLRRVRFLAVVGPSGCGKSSLIKAGVLAGLRDGYLDAEWRIATFCPGEKPLDNLAGEMGDRAEVRSALDRGPMGLVEAIQEQKLSFNTNVLIVVDQFEELFQFVERRGDAAREEAKAFLKLLLAAAASDAVPIYIVMTMRIEWLSECATYTGLAEAINEGIYLVPQMSRRQFQQAILGPIEAAEGSITSALLDRMLNDLDMRADQLPVLQHALLRIWQRRQPGDPLSIPVYEEVGTFSDCLSNHANEIFASFSAAEKKTAEGLFRSITQVVKSRRVRRPRPLGEIAAETGQPLAELKAVVEAFRTEGRSFLVATAGELNESSIIDISHEALIRQWGLLAKWVDDEAATVARIGRLEDAAAEWSGNRERYEGALYRGWVLKQNEELMPRLKPDSAAVAFLKASRRAQRIQSWLRWGMGGMVLLLAIAGLVIWEYEKLLDAREQAQQSGALVAVAEEQKKRAEQDQNNLIQDLKAVSPAGSTDSSKALEAVLDKVQAKRLYLQYFGPQQQGLAHNAAVNLGSQGFSVPPAEDVSGKAKPTSNTVVRYFHEADKDTAAKCKGLLPLSITGAIDTQLFPNTQKLVPAGQLEIWLAPTAAAAAAGIDVNDAAHTIDWPAVKNDGITYAYLQASLGADYEPKNFKDHWNAAKSAGLIRGAYHVLDPKRAVPAQVANFVRAVGQLDAGDLPPLLIFSGPALDDAAAWLAGVRQQLGVRPVLYAGPDFTPAPGAALATLTQYPLRIGQYSPQPAVPAGWAKWTFWQFTDGDAGPFPHTVAGIGNCYRSVFNGSVQDLTAFIAQSRGGK